ncbi:MAG TPA: hypothetical protein VHB45_14360 [Alloacidobacterium sp.]|nr:hypothetical protein [Alloacidobacterium sp.]
MSLHAQTDNTFYVKQFPGKDVATKLANAQDSCTRSTSLTCVIIIDSSLAAYPNGALPTPCAQCYIIDYRVKPLPPLGGVVASVALLESYSWAALQSLNTAQLAGYTQTPLGAGTFHWTNTPTTPDGCTAFAGSDDPSGSHGAMVREMDGPLYPEMCGAIGDGVTDDCAALTRWGAAPVWEKSMHRKTYATSCTVNMNGELGKTFQGNPSALFWWGLNAPPGAEILETTNNIPIMTVYGSRGLWHFPVLAYANLQTVTMTSPSGFISCAAGTMGTTCNPYSVGLLVEPYPNIGGLYMSRDISMYVANAAIGFGIARAFYDTITGDAVISGSGDTGTTTVTVFNTPGDISTQYPWLPQMYAQLQLSDGSWFVSRIQSIDPSTNTIVMKGAAPLAAKSNAYIVHSNALQTKGEQAPVLTAINNFSNTFSYVQIFQPTFEGWYDNGVGTPNHYVQRYIEWNPVAGDNWHRYGTVKNAIYENNRDGDVMGQTNIEHIISLGSMWVHNSADGVVDGGTVHCEGCGLVTDGTAIFSWATANAHFDDISIEYSRMLADNSDLAAPFNSPIVNGVGVFMPSPTQAMDSTSATTFTGRGIWNIEQLATLENIVDSSAGASPIAYLVRGHGNGNNYSDVHIHAWTNTRDSGFFPAGQFVYPLLGPAPLIDGIMPSGTVAYGLKIPITTTGCNATTTATGRLYSTIANWLPSAISVNGGSPYVQGSPTAGIYTDFSCTTLLSSANNHSIAANTKLSNFIMPLSAMAQNQLYNTGASNNLFLDVTAASSPTSITHAATSSYCTGRNGGYLNTNICVITLASAPSLAIQPGQAIQITGSANKGLQDISGVTTYVTDVPDSTHLVVYVDSLDCTNYGTGPDASCGTETHPQPESGMTITVIPTVNAFVTGSKF